MKIKQKQTDRKQTQNKNREQSKVS